MVKITKKPKQPNKTNRLGMMPKKWAMFVVIALVAVSGTLLLHSTKAATGGDRFRIYATASQEIGHREFDSRVLEYSQGNRQNWCADFVSWVYKQSGYPIITTAWSQSSWRVPLVKDKVSGVPNLKDVFSSAGGYKDISKNYSPLMGDVVMFDNNGQGHTGIVVSLVGNVLTTIEGNSGHEGSPNRVVQRTYPDVHASNIIGWGVADVIIDKSPQNAAKH